MEERGMVVKIKGRSCIVLTPEGEYREVPLPNNGEAGVGREIPLKRKKSLPYFGHFMVAASLCLFILAGLFYPGATPQAAAYLTIDINPSIELAVSPDRRVLSARGLNADGEKILAGVRIEELVLQEAIERIVAQAVTDQYLGMTDDNVILATLTVDRDAEPVVDLDSVYEAIKKPVESSGVNAEVIIEPVRPEMRQKAAESGVSTGRYLLVQKSEKKGVPVSIQEVSAKSLGKLEREKNLSFIDLMEEGELASEDRDGDSRGRKIGQISRKGIYVNHQNQKDQRSDKPGGIDLSPGKKKQPDSRGRSDAPAHDRKKDQKDERDTEREKPESERKK